MEILVIFCSSICFISTADLLSTGSTYVIRDDPSLTETHETSISITINNETDTVEMHLTAYTPGTVWAGFGFEDHAYNPFHEHDGTYSIILDYDAQNGNEPVVTEWTLGWRSKGTRYATSEITVLSDATINNQREVVLTRPISGVFVFPSFPSNMTVISAVSNRFSDFSTSFRHESNEDDRNHSSVLIPFAVFVYIQRHIHSAMVTFNVLPPTMEPTLSPFATSNPSVLPTKTPSISPTKSPSNIPSNFPSKSPSKSPSDSPSKMPSKSPTKIPSNVPSYFPSKSPSTTSSPSRSPSPNPSSSPSKAPYSTTDPSRSPSSPPSSSPVSTPNCPNGNVLESHIETDELSVFLTLDCLAQSVLLGIIYTRFEDNWFGLVFNDEMSGDAVIYTAGKKEEAEVMAEGLHWYAINGKKAENVQYDPGKEWKRMYSEWNSDGLHVIFENELDSTPWTGSTADIQFRSAFGDSLFLQKHSSYSSETYTLRLTEVVPTTPTTTLPTVFVSESPSIHPTSAPSPSPSPSPTNTPTPTTVPCPNGNVLAGRQETEHLAVIVILDCLYNTISMDITLRSFNNNWFGLVFNEEMIGDALVYTVGKSGDRAAGLYAYGITGKQRENVQYEAANDWNELLSETVGDGIHILYEQELIKTPWNANTNWIQFRYAIGSDLVLEYHSFRSENTFSIILDSFTLNPSTFPTFDPSEVPSNSPSKTSRSTLEPLISPPLDTETVGPSVSPSITATMTMSMSPTPIPTEFGGVTITVTLLNLVKVFCFKQKLELKQEWLL